MGRTKKLTDKEVENLYTKYVSLITGLPATHKELAVQYKADRILPELKQYCNTYPALGLQITRSELTVITSLFPSGTPVPAAAKAHAALKSPLEKLLYALAWKKSDVHKLQKIISGVDHAYRGVTAFPKTGVVFYQFGRHLASPREEPIVDQHTIRAFTILTHMGTSESWVSDRMKDGLTIYDVLQYRAWIGPLAGAAGKNLRLLDQVMFFLGKVAKGQIRGVSR